MKRLLALLLALSLVILLSACDKAENFRDADAEEPVTEAPTQKPTEAPTPAPTPAPTAAPTEAPTPGPTPTPDFSAFIPQTGNLVGGPIFPEPFKYLVLPGESNMHYVFNNMGEFLYSFAASMDDDTYYDYGLYTADGICCWHVLSDGSETEPFFLFCDMAITVRYVPGEDEENWWEESYYEISLIRDRALGNPIEIGEGKMRLGKLGGILKIDGGYIVVERDYGSVEHYLWGWDDGESDNEQKLTRFDENFNRVGKLDSSRFGFVRGVLGGKYILAWSPSFSQEEYYENGGTLSVYTLDGRQVMENVKPYYDYGYSGFWLDDELWETGLISVEYVCDEDGNYYDGNLNRVNKEDLPERQSQEEAFGQPYYYDCVHRIEATGLQVMSGNGAYDGIRDGDGNWLFRIYGLRFAEDSDNWRYGFGEYWW